MSNKDLQLQKVREQIDDINKQILNLISERGELAKQVGRIKIQQGKDLYDPTREQEIINRLMESNKGPFDNNEIEEIFKVIFKTSLELQKKIGEV